MDSDEMAQARLRALLEGARPPTGGVPLDDIAKETAPLLPLVSELSEQEREAGDYESFEFRECLTVLTLLGRRLALLDLTPTAAVQVVQLALRAADESEGLPARQFAERAVAAAIEGFVLGREERVLQQREAQAAKHVHPLRIDEKIFALIISGVHEPSMLSEHVDALGRAMLDADAEIAIVDLSQLGEANRDRAAAMFAADEVVRMLGGFCFFSGVDARWESAIADARIDVDPMQITESFGAALAAARAAADETAAGRVTKWRSLLDLLRRSR